MTTIWNDLQDISLDEKYRLQELLGEADGAAYYRTEFGPDRQPAALKLMPETSSAAGEAQLERWRMASRIAHPNILRLLDYGSAEEEGGAFLYAVFEFPDDSLEGAAGRGPLSAEETRAVLAAAVDGLGYIHSQGLVHGAIDASHVVAVGNQIKLSTDTLRLPSRDATAGDDVRALGLLVYQLISGRRLEAGREPDYSGIPAAFRTVIERSVAADPNQRWPLAQLLTVFDVVAPETTPVRARPVPRWIFVATPVFLILVILIFRGIKPKAEVPVAPPVPVAAAPPKAAVTRGWRVIAYTYTRRALAEKKVQSINRKWSGAQAEVLEPGAGKPGNYLVALGGAMDREQALRFLRAARSKGMPRGTYVRGE